MARVIKLIEYNTRSVHFQGVAVFSSMGKWVTDWMRRFSPNTPGNAGFRITDLSEEEYEAENGLSAAHELRCIEEVLDAHQIPKTLPDGAPFTLHGRVGHAIESLKKED